MAMENLVNAYVTCWAPNTPNLESGSLYENNDFGCENSQIFRNNINIELFTHEEVCSLSWLLTRELRGQINMDHYVFWSWCASIIDFQASARKFPSGHWLNDEFNIVKAFVSVVNLILSASRSLNLNGSEEVNDHMLVTYVNRYLLVGPLCCTILEGVLRRKNVKYIDREGVVLSPFKIGTIQYSPVGHSTRGKHNMNQIAHSFRLLENYTIGDRGRNCTGLTELNNETLSLFPASRNAYEVIGRWRNTLQHGNQFWQNRVPILSNYICLMFMDEFEPAVFDSELATFKQRFDWLIQGPRKALSRLNSPYPPDF